MKGYMSTQKTALRHLLSALLDRMMMGDFDMRVPIDDGAHSNTTIPNGTTHPRSLRSTKHPRFMDNNFIRVSPYLSNMMKAKALDWPQDGGLPDRNAARDEEYLFTRRILLCGG
jgi:hypothetical protein